MCIIIDTNTLANVFDSDSLNHEAFKPVHDWVRYGGGKVVYGGSKYIRELQKKYLGVYNELRKKNRAIYIDDELVDNEETWVSKQITHPDFDDQHLVALLRVSGCKLICSLDQRAYPYFTNSLFFRPASKKPKIYNQYRRRDLLTSRNVASICLNNN